jgi:DNA-binding NtrC family response regulator
MRAQRIADANVAIAGEDLASHSGARLLITAGTQASVEAIARRIHATGTRAGLPFIRMSAGDFPNEPEMLRATCSRLLEVATGGSLLMSDVETMPALVQRQLIELLDELELARAPAAAVRLVSGTTVFLFDRVIAGRFSERLFYRLNVLHLMANDGAPVLDRQ